MQIHIELGARLGEREVAWTEADLALAAEHLAGETLQHAAQVSHGACLVDQDTLDLVEDGLMAGVYRFVAIDLAHDEGAHGRAHALHDAHLVRRGLGAQQNLSRRDPEGVLHVACGMVYRQVQRLEVVVIGLNLWPIVQLEAHRHHRAGDIAHHLRKRMDVANWCRRAGQRDIHPLAFQRGRRAHAPALPDAAPLATPPVRLSRFGRLADHLALFTG